MENNNDVDAEAADGDVLSDLSFLLDFSHLSTKLF